MRLWHYKLISVLPNKMLVSQWRECLAIKRQWEKGTLKHSLVSYVKDYEKDVFLGYVLMVIKEFDDRNIKYNKKLLEEFGKFADNTCDFNHYQEHNARYLRQCFYNLQEKYDRNIISKTEYDLICEKLKKENLLEIKE